MTAPNDMTSLETPAPTAAVPSEAMPGAQAPLLPGVQAPLLQVKNLVKKFPIAGGLLRRTVDHVHAIDRKSVV